MNKTLSGFTIVELLVVIVVIGILASITVVSYGGIQARANGVASLSLAKQVADKAQMYGIIYGAYPEYDELKYNRLPGTTTGTNTAAPETRLASTDQIVLYNLDSTNGKDSVWYQPCGVTGNSSGARILYYDYEAKAISSVDDMIVIGTCP